MRKFLIPTKDTTIYQAFPSNNSGLDEILEIGKVVDNTLIEPNYSGSSARTLMYFDLPTSQSVSSGSSYFLNLRLANATDVHRGQPIIVYPISRSWDEGSGYFYQNVKNSSDGATWSAASTSVSWSSAGGDYTSTPTASVTLTTYPLQDIRVDVTNIIRPLVNSNSASYGLMVKFPTTDELDSQNLGNVKVFSAQTHTIHQPTLEVAWDDQSFVTGSLTLIPSLNTKISPSNLKQVYGKGDIVKINLVTRDEYPVKSFDSTLRYKNKYYLPTSSYYSVVDTQSNTTVIPFDSYSKINCDTLGSYITLDTSGLYTGRCYTLKLRVNLSAYTQTIDTGTIFTII